MLRIIPSILTLLTAMVMVIHKAPCQELVPPEKPLKIAQLLYEINEKYIHPEMLASIKYPGYASKRTVYALYGFVLNEMNEILESNIRKRWNCSEEIPDLVCEKTKPYAFNKYYFNTQKKPFPLEPGYDKYLFMRVKDIPTPEWESIFNQVKDWRDEATILSLQCKVYATRGAIELVFNRSMYVVVERMPVPPEEYPLFRLPGLPDSFMAAFTRAVEVFLAPETPPDTMVVQVPTACILLDLRKDKIVKIPLTFSFEGDRIEVSGVADLSWQVGKIVQNRNKFKTKTRDGFLSGLWVETKISAAHRIPIRFSEDTSITMITIPFIEDKYNRLPSERKVVSDCFYSIGKDTLGRFRFGATSQFYPIDTAGFFWDGYDSATIRFLSYGWTNRGLYVPTIINGYLYNKFFDIHNIKAGNMFDISYDGKLIATIKTIYGRPEKGYLYNPDLRPEIYRALMAIATIPFAYYGQ